MSNPTHSTDWNSPAPEAADPVHLTSHLDKKPEGLLARIGKRLGLEPYAADLREQLEHALKEETGAPGIFKLDERVLLRDALRFGSLRVEDVMVPRANIVAIDESAPISELMQTFREAGHSRIPVYRETLDDPRGMVHIKTLMRWIVDTALGKATEPSEAPDHPDVVESPGQFALACLDLSCSIAEAGIITKTLFVPRSMSAVTLLKHMQKTPAHMALVIDEYGGTDGLVTIENLIEEIVGDIEDEYDSANLVEIREENGVLIVPARTPIEELAERLGGINLLDQEHEDDIDTLGGLIFTIAGRVPLRGEVIEHPKTGIEFEIAEADPRRVKLVRIRLNQSALGERPALEPRQADEDITAQAKPPKIEASSAPRQPDQRPQTGANIIPMPDGAVSDDEGRPPRSDVVRGGLQTPKRSSAGRATPDTAGQEQAYK